MHDENVCWLLLKCVCCKRLEQSLQCREFVISLVWPWILHLVGSGREGAHFLSLCGLMSYQDQVCSALRRQGSQEPFPDECCQRVFFVKLEVLKRPYLFLLFFRFWHVAFFLGDTNSIISRILLSVYLQIRCSCKLANLQGCLCRLQHLKEL